MTTLLSTITGALIMLLGPTASPGPDPLGCTMVDLATVETLLGSGAVDAAEGDDSAPDVCVFQGPEGWALLTIMRHPADLYDQITIRRPHTPAEVGDRGRYNVDEATGAVAVQFVKGDASVTLSLQMLSEREGDFVAPMLDVARAVADRVG
ncbi:MAG: hypothetical protein MJB57_12900 [Gemmatimonadetes bacterium]|nr:hypothetical protein [Gemmatimonadota bacterium]